MTYARAYEKTKIMYYYEHHGQIIIILGQNSNCSYNYYKYEDLIEDSEKNLNKIIDFLE